MRKLIYGCCALTILGAVAAYLVADYGVRHPDSLVGHCVAGTARISAELNPLTFFDRVTALDRTGPIACEVPARQQQVAQVREEDDVPPPEAAQDEEENVNPPEVIRVENGVDGADEGGRAIDDGTDRCPAHEDAEAPVVQETPEPAGQVLPEYGPNEAPWHAVLSDELDPGIFNQKPVSNEDPNAAVQESGKVKACAFMPYCEDDDEVPAADARTNSSFWHEVQHLHLWQAEPAPAQDGSTKTDPTSNPASEATPGDQGTQEEPSTDQSEGTDAQGDKTQSESDQYNYHRYHDLSCPYTGCPYPTYRCPPQNESLTPATQEASPLTPEQMQQLRKKKKMLFPQPEVIEEPGQQGAVVPVDSENRTQGVDTAEYRPSDGDEDAFNDLQY